MNGLYIHIPFCRKACHYCNFHFSTQLSYVEDMTEAICKEILLTQTFFSEKKPDTIYFGGGTPSVLSREQLGKIFQTLQSVYDLSSLKEVTIETNPDDLNSEYLNDLKKYTPINRLSIGIQSFNDEHLKWMNRSHHAQQAMKSIELSRAAGFDNMTIDLIYGLPDTLPDCWEDNLNKFVDLQLPHLSAYSLTVEPKTALAHFVQKKTTEMPDDEKALREFKLLRAKLIEAGYKHYEVSNFAKPGFQAVHNSGYWEDMTYLGIGPGAHSYRKDERRWNVQSNIKYIKSLSTGKPDYTAEKLSNNDLYNEFIMTGLRKVDGINLDKLELKFGKEERDYLLNSCDPYLKKGILVFGDGSIRLSEENLFTADSIIAGLFKD